MNEFIKIRVPFYKRITNGGTDGLATFYLKEMPKYLPQSVGSKVIITHTDIADSSGLKTKLNNLSTNTVVGYFQQVDENISPDSIYQSDGYSIFFVAQYDDLSFSTNQFAGNCRGYIEYYVAPSALNILKPIETSVIVSEKIPFNDEEGYIKLKNNGPTTGITEYYKCMFIDREDKETIFSSLLKSLNVPITIEEKKKYTRSPLGYLQPSSIKTDIIQNGYYYDWIEYTGGTQPSANLIVHPTTGFTGEYFNTVLETISIDKSHNISGTPIDNRLYFVMEIPNKKYGEIIDGKSVHIILNGTGSTVYDIYGTYNKKNLTTSNLDNVLSEIDLSVKDIGSPVTLNNGDYESNIVLLFATGNTGTDWAKGYSDIKNGDKVFNPTNQIKETYDYYTDRCVGYAVLDKGFIVITDKKIVESLFKNKFSGDISGSTIMFPIATGLTTNKCVTYQNSDFIVTKDVNNHTEWNNTQFHITGTTNYIEYFSYNTEKSLNIVCLASCDEFYKSTNDTAKELLNLEENADVADFKTDDLNLHPIMISQIGIHDSDGNLLAICKPNQPIKKYWHDILSFNIKIRI